MSSLADRRCRNHPAREAAVLCPGCNKAYCRECVTEHDDRMLCSECISKTHAKTRTGKFALAWFGRAGQVLVGFLMLWFFFYYLGQVLLLIPSSFHEGTVWEEFFPEESGGK